MPSASRARATSSKAASTSADSIQSVSGINTVSGLITLPYGAVIGADAGSTLRIYGGIQNTVGNNTLMLNAKGDIVLGNTEMSFGGTTRFNSVEKLGAGTLRIESSNVTEVIDQTTNGLLIRQGTVLVDTNGSWRSRVFLDVGSVLRLDNTAVNFSTGRLSTTAGGIYKNITFRGGWLDILGGTMSASATVEGFQDTTFGKGLSMISLKQQSLALQPTNLVFRGAAWGNNAPTQGTSAPGVSMVFRGVGHDPGFGPRLRPVHQRPGALRRDRRGRRAQPRHPAVGHRRHQLLGRLRLQRVLRDAGLGQQQHPLARRSGV